jgi:hypothetical protein
LRFFQDLSNDATLLGHAQSILCASLNYVFRHMITHALNARPTLARIRIIAQPPGHWRNGGVFYDDREQNHNIGYG